MTGDALLVANAALRFTPAAPEAREQRSLLSRLLPRPPRVSPKPPSRDRGDRRRHRRAHDPDRRRRGAAELERARAVA
jgi:hypothetical protein